MKCIHCKGKMNRGTVPFHIDRKGCHLMLERVPAGVCEQCGEAYFEEKEVDTIQELIDSVEQKAEEFTAVG
jgi:YgiT-type zinc finger domain-containing protein